MHDFAPYGKHNVFIDQGRPLKDLLEACGFDKVDEKINFNQFVDVVSLMGSKIKRVPSLALVDVSRLPVSPKSREEFCFENGYRYAGVYELLAYRELGSIRMGGRAVIARGATCEIDGVSYVLTAWHSSYSSLSLQRIRDIDKNVSNQAFLLAAHGG